MKLFEDELTYDFYPYILVLKIQTWVSDFLEVSVEHKAYWFFREPSPPSPVPPLSPLPRFEDFGLTDVPPKWLRFDYVPSALPMGKSSTTLGSKIIDLTSNSDEED
ncbi:hypothetical protein CJ030_MR2G016340 [Morella rubra]|uniref:Uncharacterized protein n=1 Tax=Morella rubra TaxID=262757 RepID=A0A6A1WGW6_9ROSI|nr:hypothetical protein CJ030_MR2G016335 [Morella rubra]KAB1224451.1 hypothetical protein CJ030_MR2G016340 [Morella rubra]